MKRTPLVVILIVALVDLIGFGLIIPLQAVYAERLGATGLIFGLLVGAYSAMQFVFNPILGRWSDRVGRRRVLIVSIGGSVLSHLLLGVADLAHSLPLLFAARLLDGITGANIATAQAYIADVTTTENRAKGMGFFGAAFGLGFMLGPAIGALLALVGHRVSGDAGTSWPAFGAAAIALAALLIVWRWLPESVEKRKAGESSSFRFFSLAQMRKVMWDARLGSLVGILGSATFAFVLLEVTFVFLCAHFLMLKEAGTGIVFAYIGLLMVIVQGGLVGRLAPRFGEMNLVSVGPFLTATGFVLLSLVPAMSGASPSWWLVMAACVPIALGQGLFNPNLTALISRESPAAEQGATLGVSQGIGSLARAIAPPLGGWLYDLGPAWPYRAGALMFVLIGGYALVTRLRHAAPVASASTGR